MKTLSVIYDLKRSPITFDFVTFLAIADCYRQFHRYDRIHLTILVDGFRTLSDRDLQISVEEKLWRVNGILLQCASICPSVKELTVTDEEAGKEYHFPPGYPHASTPYLPLFLWPFRKDTKPSECFKSPPFAHDLVPQADVTLTVRSSKYFRERNVDLSDWMKFHGYLRDKGYKVAVIPDQEDAETYSFDWHGDVYAPAAFDMRLRLAAYEAAKMNVGSAHGPFSVLFYTHAPYLMFDHLRNNVNTASWHEKGYGFPVGGQHAWSNADQIITWEDSTVDNLIRWFRERAE